MREEERKLIKFSKFMLIVIIGLIIVEFGSCSKQVEGAIITGEKPLGGASLLMQMVIDKRTTFDDPEDIILLSGIMKHFTRRDFMMESKAWERHYDVHLYQRGALVASKIYHDVKTIKINKRTNMIEVFMEDGSSVPVNADRYTVDIRTRDKWGI